MKSKFFILAPIVLLALLVRTTTASACGSSDGGDCCGKKEVKNCCTPTKTCATSSNARSETNSTDDCGGDCQHDGCPCQPTPPPPVPAALAAEPIEFLKMPNAHFSKKSAWRFAAEIPQPVHLAIWLPPKIGV